MLIMAHYLQSDFLSRLIKTSPYFHKFISMEMGNEGLEAYQSATKLPLFKKVVTALYGWFG